MPHVPSQILKKFATGPIPRNVLIMETIPVISADSRSGLIAPAQRAGNFGNPRKMRGVLDEFTGSACAGTAIRRSNP
jgi:hypothetical protein